MNSVVAEERLSPRQSGEFIAKHSKHVTVLHDNIPDAAQIIYERMKKGNYSKSTWKSWPLHPKELTRETVDWIFVIDSLNFSFWLPGDKQFQLEYEGKVYEDYEALCAAINRALKEGIQITTPSYYKDVSLDTLKHIFRSSNHTTLPLLEERTKILNENGTILNNKYNNSFSNLISLCDNEIVKAIQLIEGNFPTFCDFGSYSNQAVSFSKRVQILLADIWACFEGDTFGSFKDVNTLTMFPDYRVPQTLLAINVMEYSTTLMNKLKTGIELDHNSDQEMEIRGCSIHVVELLQQKIKSLAEIDIKLVDINSVIVDFYLWDYATQSAELMTQYPEHRTRSIFY